MGGGSREIAACPRTSKIARELLHQVAPQVGPRTLSPAALARLAAHDWPGKRARAAQCPLPSCGRDQPRLGHRRKGRGPRLAPRHPGTAQDARAPGSACPAPRARRQSQRRSTSRGDATDFVPQVAGSVTRIAVRDPGSRAVIAARWYCRRPDALPAPACVRAHRVRRRLHVRGQAAAHAGRLAQRDAHRRRPPRGGWSEPRRRRLLGADRRGARLAPGHRRGSRRDRQRRARDGQCARRSFGHLEMCSVLGNRDGASQVSRDCTLLLTP
jgi:hypothetical protein